MIAMMATQPMAQGPAGERLGPQLRKLRRAAGLDQVQLSDRLAELGHPLAVSAISRIESGQRRADVSDLFALAAALDVTPNLLCIPEGQLDDQVRLVEDLTVTWQKAWLWATGREPLKEYDVPDYTEIRDWRAKNNPQIRPMPRDMEITGEQFDPYLTDFAKLVSELEKMEDRIPRAVLHWFLQRLQSRFGYRSGD